MGELKQDFQGYDFTLLDEAKQAVEGVAENIQEATLDQYTRVVKRLSTKGQLPIEAAQTKGSYYAYRAAWIGYYAHQIRVQVGRLKIWGKQWSEMDPERWMQERALLRDCLDQLQQCPPDPKRKQRQRAIDYDQAIAAGQKPDFEYSNECREKGLEKSGAMCRSKKHRTRSLPNDWRDGLFQAALDKPSKHRLALAVLMCCGCRPKELENGIEIQLDPEHQRITFVIISAKRRSHAMETRQFTIQNPQSLAFRYLLSQSVLHGKTLTLRQVNYQAVSKEVERLGRLAFEFSKEGISPYCLRHAFSGDLHAAGLSREDIARCLGHKTDETQRHYSRSVKHSSGGFKITDIHSTEPVKALVDAKIQKLIESQSASLRLF